MRRGDVVTVALPGGLGKPRPALIVQTDLFGLTTPTVTVLPFTGTWADAPLFRLELQPNAENGLARVCYLQVDKATSVPRGKIGAVIGRLDDVLMLAVSRALVVFLGLV